MAKKTHICHRMLCDGIQKEQVAKANNKCFVNAETNSSDNVRDWYIRTVAINKDLRSKDRSNIDS